MRALLPLAALLPFAACAAAGGAHPAASHVADGVARGDVPALSAAVVAFVSMRQPPGPVALQAPRVDPVGLTDRVAADLRAAGHALSPTGRNRLVVQAETFGEGVLLRVLLDDARAARVLDRMPGGTLAGTGPYTVTSGEPVRLGGRS